MPFKNYTLGVEVDPNNRFAVSVNTIDVTGLTRQEEAYIYVDKGAGNISGNQNVSIKVNTGSGDDAAYCYPYAIANGLQTFNNNFDMDAIGMILLPIAPDVRIYILEYYSLSFYGDFFAASPNTDYWGGWTRVGTSLQMIIYSDEAKTTPVDTLNLTLQAELAYRYRYYVNSHNTSNANTMSCSLHDLDLHESISILRRRLEGY